MDNTSTSRVKRWREKQAIKAGLYETLNRQRCATLCLDYSDERPEYVAVRKFFESYPYLSWAPLALDFGQDEGFWLLHVPLWLSEHDIAAAVVAMQRATSAPFRLIAMSEDKSVLISPDDVPDESKAEVERRIDELKRAGVWEE